MGNGYLGFALIIGGALLTAYVRQRPSYRPTAGLTSAANHLTAAHPQLAGLLANADWEFVTPPKSSKLPIQTSTLRK